MTATEILSSIDRQIADLRNEYESTITSLKSELVQAKAAAAAARDMLDREASKASSAVHLAATLVAHFGTVSKVFEDARTVAEKAKTLFSGFEQKTAEVAQTITTGAEKVTSDAIAAVESALHSHLEPGGNAN